jgi:hypothetical protein
MLLAPCHCSTNNGVRPLLRCSMSDCKQRPSNNQRTLRPCAPVAKAALPQPALPSAAAQAERAAAAAGWGRTGSPSAAGRQPTHRSGDAPASRPAMHRMLRLMRARHAVPDALATCCAQPTRGAPTPFTHSPRVLARLPT